MMIKTLFLIYGLYLAAFAGHAVRFATADLRVAIKRRICLGNTIVLGAAIIALICGYKTANIPLLYGSVAVALFASAYRLSR
ncbi:MAG: hypothetical protein KC777_06970 [Cyanobacteria bacterium HKST-UBA02]|nr:hypothetical protein [Cyanobacteria bacterium HKST-UBA02]